MVSAPLASLLLLLLLREHANAFSTAMQRQCPRRRMAPPAIGIGSILHHHHHHQGWSARRPSLSTTAQFMGFSVTFGGNNNDDDDDKKIGGMHPPPSAPLEEEVIEHGMISDTSRALQRVSWLSWWAQVILTTVSAVTLGFSRNVFARSTTTTAGEAAANFFLPGCGICLSITSILWTWANGWRLSRRMIRKPTTLLQAATLLRRAIRVGVTLNLVGLLLSLLGAEQIVGVLAIKVLTRGTSPAVYAGMGAQPLDLLQPLDILIVQANTNLLLSHFVSLVSLLWLTNRLEKLDPPDGKRSR